MEENKQEIGKNGKDNYTLRMIVAVMVLLVLTLSELYIMLNFPENYVALIVLTVIALADVYVLIASWIQKNYKLEAERRQQYEDLFKSEKASYLIIRKSFEELNERLDYIEDIVEIPAEEIINAQKSIAKVTINRNKENSDALMNCNDKMVDIICGLEDKIDAANTEMLEKQKIVIDNSIKDLIMKQQEIISNIHEMELSVRNQLLSEINKINIPAPQIVMNPQSTMYTQPMEQSVPAASANNIPTETVPPVSSDEMVDFPIDENFPAENNTEAASAEDSFLTDTEFFEMASELQEAVAEAKTENEETSAADGLPDLDALFAEDEAQPEETISVPDFDIPEDEPAPAIEINSDPNHVMTPEEIAALVAGSSAPAEPEPVAEEPIAEEPAVEEPAPSIEINSDPNHVMTPEEIAALVAGSSAPAEPEPVAEEPAIEEPSPSIEISSDPNHVMTPEEIAALVAGSTSEVEEPIFTEQTMNAQSEEDSPANTIDIDMSDPNHKMTPEEIAALFANM